MEEERRRESRGDAEGTASQDSAGAEAGVGVGGGRKGVWPMKCLLPRFLFVTLLVKITSDKSWFHIETQILGLLGFLKFYLRAAGHSLTASSLEFCAG